MQTLDYHSKKPLFVVHVNDLHDSIHIHNTIVCHECMDKIAGHSIVSNIRPLTPSLCSAFDLIETPTCWFGDCRK
jgi:hypothetical protein